MTLRLTLPTKNTAVRWAPVLYGQDAGRGTIVEVILHGSVTRHGMTKHATPAEPLLDIKVHGKNLHVIGEACHPPAF